MSNWHAVLYPIRPGTEAEVTRLFQTGPSPGLTAADGAARLLSTRVFVGPGRVLRVIEYDGELGRVIAHLRSDPRAAAFQRDLAAYLDLPEGRPHGPAFFRDATLAHVPYTGATDA